jgi:A/G-specific adenine glycosylase
VTPPAADRRLTGALLGWFRRAARDLPWRDAPAGARDPYRVLVSEFMLQQTQVSRVAERFPAFIRRFPTVRALADAHEHEVLAAWSGMGYYRRARLLHAAARAVALDHQGEFPRDPAAIRDLPGVGRYTAGAVASIAHGLPEPIVDGNVARVLLRVHGRPERPDDRAAAKWLWSRAADLVSAAPDPGAFNEAIMELGATVCTPRSPRCSACPLADDCDARRLGTQDEIPPPKRPATRRPLFVGVALAVDARGRRLVEQRPPTGLWAGLWQAPSVERADRFPSRPEIAESTRLSVEADQPIDRFTHLTTHREVRFEVWPVSRGRAGGGRAWRSPGQIEHLALGTPQRRILLELHAAPDATA